MDTKLQAIAASLEKAPQHTSGHIYHPLPFPEFQHLKTSSAEKSAYRKWDLITRSLQSVTSYSGLDVLDIGANVGFYTFSFAKLGATVDAYEPHKHMVNIGRQIADATGLRVQWYNKPLESDDLAGREYDIALMLSVFQWMSEGGKRMEEAISLLHQVASSSKLLFFELGCNHGKSAISTREYPIAWVWRLLQQTTAPKHIAFLGTVVAWGRFQRYLFLCSNDPIAGLNWHQRLLSYALCKQWIR